jgi:hypothetical protein
MKKIFLLICVFIALKTFSQDCNNYYFLQSKKTVEMTIYDKKGDVSGRLVYTISDVTNSDGYTTASVRSEMFDKKGKTIAKGNSVMKCNAGVMMINMKMIMPVPQTEQYSQASVKAQDFFIEYPVNMSKGDPLKDGNLSMDIDNNGIPQSLTMVIFDRKVEDKEKVTTPAGSWDSYKISYKTKMTIKMMGAGIPVTMEGTEWYAPGFGVVKTQSKHGATELTSIK